jgi:hypothetical protein
MPELLIVGGLTIDRFPDGASAPGGSVIHSGAAANAEGVRPSILTVAGPEPEAADGLGRLRAIGPVTAQSSAATTTYRHTEADGRRVLVLDALSASIAVPRTTAEPVDVALLGPIASELDGVAITDVARVLRPRLTVMLLQGWLRRLVVGEAVHPLALSEVDARLWAAFGTAHAVVVSTEDLAEAPGDPFAQAAELRALLGSRPVLVLTLGAEGYLLDDPAADRLVASVPRRVVEGVPMVGAGDTFGAAIAIHLARTGDPFRAAAAATDAVIRMLEARR